MKTERRTHTRYSGHAVVPVALLRLGEVREDGVRELGAEEGGVCGEVLGFKGR